jgi:hypothetical protein
LAEVNTNVGIATKPQNLVGKNKYKCKYSNKTPKFQLVAINISASIVSLNEELTLTIIPACMVTSK